MIIDEAGIFNFTSLGFIYLWLCSAQAIVIVIIIIIIIIIKWARQPVLKRASLFHADIHTMHVDWHVYLVPVLRIKGDKCIT